MSIIAFGQRFLKSYHVLHDRENDMLGFVYKVKNDDNNKVEDYIPCS